jgi:glyoxylase-like metal-dependent hydrolase (beta-lactamase superfamily II)
MYITNKIGDSLFIIGEQVAPGFVNAMGLVIGSEKAALIDTAQGIAEPLAPFVKTLADKPIIVLLTHGDPDHIGQVSQFSGSEIYMSRKDDNLIEWATQGKRFEYRNISDGDTFDLGGVTLEVFEIPGHTKGSVCFFNRAEKYVLAGDSINPMPWLWLDRCTPIAEYVKSVERFRGVLGDYAIYCGHAMEALPGGIADDIIAAGKEVAAGKTDGDVPFTMPFPMSELAGKDARMHKAGGVMLIYNKDNY